MSAPRKVVLGLVATLLVAMLPLRLGLAANLAAASKALTPLRTCTVTATPSSTTVVADTSVRQGTPAGNFGTINSMNVASGNSANRRVYVRFDLAGCSPSIPATATVRAATLRLYASALPAVCRTVDVFRVTATWTETGVTWNTQPFGTTINNPASGSRTDSFDVGSVAGCENQAAGYMNGASVTADVAAFITGTANYGWMLRDDAENSAPTRTITFSTKETASLAQAPQLVVTYVNVP